MKNLNMDKLVFSRHIEKKLYSWNGKYSKDSFQLVSSVLWQNLSRLLFRNTPCVLQLLIAWTRFKIKKICACASPQRLQALVSPNCEASVPLMQKETIYNVQLWKLSKRGASAPSMRAENYIQFKHNWSYGSYEVKHLCIQYLCKRKMLWLSHLFTKKSP